jgi:hypothetical protein
MHIAHKVERAVKKKWIESVLMERLINVKGKIFNWRQFTLTAVCRIRIDEDLQRFNTLQNSDYQIKRKKQNRPCLK